MLPDVVVQEIKVVVWLIVIDLLLVEVGISKHTNVKSISDNVYPTTPYHMPLHLFVKKLLKHYHLVLLIKKILIKIVQNKL